MANVNPLSDILYEFWRWEYLRRNSDYRRMYDIMAANLNELGVTGFKNIEVDGNSAISIFDCLCTNREIPPEYYIEIFFWLFRVAEKFKVFPPPSPTYGIASQELFEKIVEEEASVLVADNPSEIEGMVDYANLPRGNYCPFPMSTVIRQEDLQCLQPELPKEIQKANERFYSHNPILSQYSKIESSFLEQVNSIFTNTEKAGKYEIIPESPKSVRPKDKKAIIATDSFLKSGQFSDYTKLKAALRNQKKAWLKIDGKRIKRRNFSRAAGLFLWDLKEDQGCLNKQLIDYFYNEMNRLYEKLEDKYGPHEIERYVLDEGHELRKIINNTDKCIKKMDVLPII